MSERSRGRSCLRYGCFGCLGLVAIGVLVVVVIAVLATISKREPNVERRELSQTVPGIELPEPDLSQATGDTLPPVLTPRDLAASQAGRVVLELKLGRFTVLPGEPGEPIRVEAEYDVNRFVLEQRFETGADGNWTYHLSSRPRGWLMTIGDFEEPRVRLYLPPGSPFALEGDIGMGESDLELGGLWLTAVDLEVGMGDHKVGFDAPTVAPLERFELTGSMGALRVARLGNASPAQVGVSHRMGELRLDLRGDWTTDSDVTARCKMGECRLTLPRDVAVDIRGATVAIGEKVITGVGGQGEPVPGAPTIHLTASATMGGLRIDD